MDDLTFPQAFTVLLKLHEHPTTAAQILTAMEAPYLFLQRDGHYIAGNGFFSPKWLHMYLRPLGLQLTKHTFVRAEVGIFLKNNAPAIVQLANRRYVCVHSRSGQRIFLGEKYTTLPTLIKHSPDQLPPIRWRPVQLNPWISSLCWLNPRKRCPNTQRILRPFYIAPSPAKTCKRCTLSTSEP